MFSLHLVRSFHPLFVAHIICLRFLNHVNNSLKKFAVYSRCKFFHSMMNSFKFKSIYMIAQSSDCVGKIYIKIQSLFYTLSFYKSTLLKLLVFMHVFIQIYLQRLQLNTFKLNKVWLTRDQSLKTNVTEFQFI